MTREHTLDSLEVRVEAAPGAAALLGTPDGDGPPVTDLQRRILERLRGVIGIHARLTLVAPGGLPRSEGGKLRRVVDEQPRQ